MAWWDRLLGRPTLESVARDATAWLHALGITEVRFDPKMRELVAMRDGSPMQIYLGNLLTEMEQTPRAGRAALLERFMSGLLPPDDAVPAGYEDAKSRLMPVVRSLAHIGASQLAGARNAASDERVLRPAYQPLVADLVVSLVCDLPTSMAYVTQQHLAGWGRSFEQVLPDALHNLRGLRELGGWKQLATGVWSGEWGDAYESSRLLLPDLIYRLGVHDPVVMVPYRHALLVTSAANPGGLALLADVIGSSMDEATRWLSFRPLRLVDGRWVEFVPDASTAEKLRVLQLRNDADAYGGQKQQLDEIHAARGIDVFVATYQLMQRDGGAPVSFAVWAEGVDTLLPPAESIAFAFRDGESTRHVLLPWTTVREEFAALMEPTEHLPPLWRVRGFPDPAALQRLGAAPDR